MTSYGSSISGVPIVFGRTRTLRRGPARRRVDPLSAARGLTIGLAAALLLWMLIAASLGVF